MCNIFKFSLCVSFGLLTLNACTTTKYPFKNPAEAVKATEQDKVGLLAVTTEGHFQTISSPPAYYIKLKNTIRGNEIVLAFSDFENKMNAKTKQTPFLFALPVGEYQIVENWLQFDRQNVGRNTYDPQKIEYNQPNESFKPFFIKQNQVFHLAILSINTNVERQEPDRVRIIAKETVRFERPNLETWEKFESLLSTHKTYYQVRDQQAKLLWSPLVF